MKGKTKEPEKAEDPVVTWTGQPIKVSQAELVFGGPSDFEKLCPPKELWDEEGPNKYKAPDWARRLQRDMFFSGVQGLRLIPKKGVDPNLAFRHIQTILGSYKPKHEHKEAMLGYLFDLWFKSATWEQAEHLKRR